MTQRGTGKVIERICKYEIVLKPGLFTEDQPDDSATEKVKREWEDQRQAKIIEDNTLNADHSNPFSYITDRTNWFS